MTAYNTGGADPTLIKKIKPKSVDVVYMSYSMTFFSGDSLRALAKLISHVLKPDGLFITMHLDGDRVDEKIPNKSDKFDTSSFSLERKNKNEILITMKQQKTLVEDQTEFLAKFEPIEKELNVNGLKIIEDTFVRPHYALNSGSTKWYAESIRHIIAKK
jgi:hypothetical protein